MSWRPNVLLVVLSSVRADHVSCYGYSRETTPFLDQIGREGVRFPNMFATAAWTLPSHASLFTGLYAASHGATDESHALSGRFKTLPEHLKAAGYRSAAFCTNPWVSPETGFGRGWDAFFTQRYHNRLAGRAVIYGRRASDALLRRRDSGARRTNQALRRWLAAGNEPFFGFVHYSEAHFPLRPPSPYNRMFVPKGMSASRVEGVEQNPNMYLAQQADLPEDKRVTLTALYDGALRYIDTRLREVADFLKDRGDWERTLVVIVGDHGEHLGERGMLGHKSGLADALLRVPLLLRCPGQVPEGFVVDELAQTVDILPTILRIVGLPEETGRLQGRALLDGGRATPGPDFAIAERFRPQLTRLQEGVSASDVCGPTVRQKAIRTKREKFIWRSDEANEYYDLLTDRGETVNLVEREPERADELRRRLFDWLASVEPFEAAEPAPALDGWMRRELQGLGYLD